MRYAIASAQTLDLLTLFVAVTAYGTFLGESNPIAREVFQVAGWTGIAGIKVAATIWICYAVDRFNIRIAGYIAILAGIVGALSNAIAVWLLL